MDSDTPPLKKTKEALRSRVRQILSTFPSAKRSLFSSQAIDLLTQSPSWKNCHTLLAFASTPREMELRPLIQICFDSGKTCCFPKVVGQDLHIYSISALSDLQKGRFGIDEPLTDPARRVDPGQLDLLLIPGLAFDRKGHRLGQGGGYYDRFLSHPALHALKVGCFFSTQEVDSVPTAPHDLPLDTVLTEKEWITCNK